MPDIARVLKEEIQRLARKEARAATASLCRDMVVLKRTATDHKRRLSKLERDNRQMVAHAEKRRKESLSASEDEIQSARITGKMIRGIRARLKLSQAHLAMLVGVNPQTVYPWWHKEGRLNFRGDAQAAIVAVRKLNQIEAQQRIEALREKKAAKGKRRPKRK